MDVVTAGAILVGVVLTVVSYFIFQWATREKGIHELNPATLRLVADDDKGKSKGKVVVKPKKMTKPKEKSEESSPAEHSPPSAASSKPSPSQSSTQESPSATANALLTESKRRGREASSGEAEPAGAAVTNAESSSSADAGKKSTGKQGKSGRRHMGMKVDELSDAVKRVEEDILVAEPQKWESVGKGHRKPSPPVVSQTAAKQPLQPKVEQVVKVEHVSSNNAPFSASQQTAKPVVEEKKQDHPEPPVKTVPAPAESQYQTEVSRRNEVLQADNQRLRSELSQQVDKYDTFEQTVRQKLAETVQLKEENTRLTATLTSNHQKVQQCQQLLREVEILKQELKHKAHTENVEIGETKKLVEKLQRENSDLTHGYRDAVAAKSQFENELKKLKDQQQSELKRQVDALNADLDRVISDFNEAKNGQIVQAKEKEAIKGENEKLHKEVEQWKRSFLAAEKKIEKEGAELAKMTSLAEKLSEAESLHRTQRERCTGLEEANRTLEKKLDSTEKKLADMTAWYKKHESEKSDKLEEAKRQAEKGQEAEQALKRNRELEAEVIAATAHPIATAATGIHHHHPPSLEKVIGAVTPTLPPSPSSAANPRPRTTSWNRMERSGLANLTNVLTPSLLLSAKAEAPLPATAAAANNHQAVNGSNNGQVAKQGKGQRGGSVHVLEWPVPDWEAPKAPRVVSICGSYWGWKEQQPMERGAKGFTYRLELAEHFVVNVQHPFLFKFVVDGVWQCSSHYPRAVDVDGIENNYLVFDDDEV